MRPFDSAPAYQDHGWRGTLPLPIGQKKEPPPGYTGAAGRWPDEAKLLEWGRNGVSNLALRLPATVMGLDVDAYGDKAGAATLAGLEAAVGPLPPTWISTSRDLPSGIRLFTIPAEAEPRLSEPGGGIELIRFGHRYIVAAPSMHPEGRHYRWIRPDGSDAADGELPRPEELPALPAAWIERLTGSDGAPALGYPARRASEREAADWLAALPDGESCAHTAKLGAELRAAARREFGSANEESLGIIARLVSAARAGHPGVPHVLEEAGAIYVETIASRLGPRDAQAEWDRLVLGRAVWLLGRPDLEPQAADDFGCDPITVDFKAAPDKATPAEPPDNWPEPPAEAAFHGVAGDLVRAVEAHTEADPVAILGSIIAIFGAVVGDHRTLYQGSQQRANLFVALVGETSSGRKGTATSIAREIYQAAYPAWEKIIVPGLGSGEGLVGYLKRHAEEDHRALVLETELGRLLGVMGREGSTLSPILRDAWDGGAIGRVLARDEAIVTRHHVGILAHVTPAELRSKLTDVDGRNGFANRFLWLAVRRTRLVPFPASPGVLIEPYLEPLHKAIAEAQAPAELTFTAAAADRWEDLYAESAMRRQHGLAAAVTARAEAQTARLALVYALLARSPAIDLVHLEAAEALWDFARRSAVFVFGDSTGNRDADALRRMLADGPVEWDAAKRDMGLRRAADMDAAMAVLVDLGIARVVSVARDGGGRPRRVVALIAGANGAKGANNA